MAQERFEAARLVQANGDTISGYLSNLASYNEIKFKTDLNRPARVIKAGTVRGYLAGPSLVRSRRVPVTLYRTVTITNGRGAPEILEVLTQNVDTVNAFLEAVVEGPITFYRMIYEGGEVYRYLEKEGRLREFPRNYCLYKLDPFSEDMLRRKPIYEVNVISATYIQTLAYMDTLRAVLQDDQYIQSLEPIPYKEKAIIDQIVAYNKARGLSNGGLRERGRRKASYGLMIGSLAVQQDEVLNLNEISNQRLLGFMVLLPTGQSRNKFFKLGVDYAAYRSSEGRRSMLAFTGGLRYASLNGAVRPYAGFGISVVRQRYNELSWNSWLIGSVEAGLNVPVRRTIFFVHGTFTPIRFVEHGYQYIGYSVGMQF